jgi:hypothetical protein
LETLTTAYLREPRLKNCRMIGSALFVALVKRILRRLKENIEPQNIEQGM